jgi:hypothetical protein
MELSMKKIALSLMFLTVAGSASAHGYYRGGGYWVAPAIVGGIVGYELGRPRYVYEAPPVVIQQPVIVQQPQVIYQQQPVQVCEQKTFQQQNGQIVSGNFCYLK